MNMTKDEFKRATAMWGIALCVFAAAVGWVFMRFGQAWSIGDLPPSEYVMQIVPAYVVTEVALIPVGGKLVDKYGCKPVLAAGAFIYIVASMVCLLSTSVEMLVALRFVQGAGAGLILGMGFTSVSRFYAPADRGKCNELMTAAFALASLFGTATGYFLTDTINWRAGYVLFPALMLIGLVVACRTLPEEKTSDRKVDVPGMILSALVFGMATAYTQMVNEQFDLLSLKSLGMVILIIALLAALVYRSYHCDGPTMPIRTTAFMKTHIVLMFMFSLCGLGLITYFFKLYLTYYEFNIYKASLMFLCMLCGAAITSMIGGRLVFRTGARPWIIGGSCMVTIGLLLTHLIADKGVPLMALSLFVFGFGLGCIVTEILCSYQSVMPKENVGQHTGNLMAVRMVGIMAGSAIIGAYINEVIERGRSMTVIDVTAADNVITALTEDVVSGLKYVADSLDTGFLTVCVILAMATTVLTAIAHNLNKDDVKALEAYASEQGSEEEE